MRLLSFLLAAAFCLTACSTIITPGMVLGGSTSLSPISPSVPALVGTWEATGKSHGGLGETLLFSPEGTLTIVMGAMVGGKYSLDGNQLTLYADVPGAGAPDVQTLAFVGDTAVITVGANNRKLIPFEARARPNSLVGQWRYIHYTGVPAYEEYTTEGTMRLRVPMSVGKGLYFVRGNTMRMVLRSPRTEERGARFTLKGDTLTLQGTDWRKMVEPWSNPYHASFRRNTEVFVRARQLLPTDLEQARVPIR